MSVVLVTSRSFGSGRTDPARDLENAGFEVARGDVKHDLVALGKWLPGAVAWIAGVSPVTGVHLDLAPNLKIVARYGVGVDAVDLEACRARGIRVTNTPGANTEAVADHTVALMLAALRHVVDGANATREGRWSSLRSRELGALTVGIAGFGRIGRAVARRVQAFGARVIAFDPFLQSEEIRESRAEPVSSLEDLFTCADVISLHLPGGGKPALDERSLSHIKSGAIIVNTARGDLLDESAVARALESGQLGGVAVDVLFDERTHASPLLTAPNAIVTPHTAAQTLEAIDRMGAMATEDVLRVLSGQEPIHRVA